MKKSKVFLSVAFALAIVAAVFTKVNALQTQYIKDASSNCVVSPEERPDCGVNKDILCQTSTGDQLFQNQNCTVALSFTP